MRKFAIFTLITGVILVIVLILTGCIGQKIAETVTEKAIEKAIEKSIENESGGEADVDLSGDEISIKTDEGEVSIGEGAELPEDFPSDVPVYPDMKISSSWKSVDNGKQNFNISAIASDSGENVFNWYKENLNGWEIQNEYTSDNGDDGKNFGITVSNGTYNINIMVVEANDEVTVIQTVTEE